MLAFSIAVLFGLGPAPAWAFMERVGVSIGLSVERVGVLYAMGTALGLTGPLLATAFGARWGRVRPIAMASILLAIACLGFGYVASAAGYVVTMLLFWPSYMFLYAFIFATVAVADPSGRLGPLTIGAYMLVLALGPAFGGMLVAAGSYAAPGWFAVAVVALMLAVLFGFRRRLNGLDFAPPGAPERV